MATQKTFNDSYANSLNEKVARGEDLQLYLNKDFTIDESQTQWVGGLVQPEGLLDKMMALTNKSQDLDAAITLYESFRQLRPVLASEKTFWIYLGHVDLYPYMHQRFPRNRLSSSIVGSFPVNLSETILQECGGT